MAHVRQALVRGSETAFMLYPNQAELCCFHPPKAFQGPPQRPDQLLHPGTLQGLRAAPFCGHFQTRARTALTLDVSSSTLERSTLKSTKSTFPSRGLQTPLAAKH